MANVINKSTKEYRTSIHTPMYDPADWLINPDVSAVISVPQKYWKLVGSPLSVVEMTQAEKDAVDAAGPIPRRGTQHVLTFEKNSRASSFRRMTVFVYEGETETGTPYEIDVIGYVDSGVTAEVRLYSKTTGAVLGLATMTNTTEDTVGLTNIPTWPASKTIVELQARRTAGNGRIYLNGMMIGY